MGPALPRVSPEEGQAHRTQTQIKFHDALFMPLMGAEPLPLGQTWYLALGPPWEPDSSSVGSPCPQHPAGDRGPTHVTLAIPGIATNRTSLEQPHQGRS